jgi:hypothetical protein
MDSRQRFLETMSFGHPDRVPLFREGIRDEVLEAWHKQGLPSGTDLSTLFHYDEFEEIEPNLDPIPYFRHWPTHISELKEYRSRLNPDDPRRLPAGWRDQLRLWKNRPYPLFIRVHSGFFLTLGVGGWQRFSEVIRLLVDDPGFVHQMMAIQGEFAARLVDRVLHEVDVDAAIFSEPISGSHGPLISPKMYAEFVLASYEPILDVLERHKVTTIILRTWANSRNLLPVVFQAGINCLWACECGTDSLDYRRLRLEFGPNIRLVGGIDTDVLRQDKPAIQRELEDKLPGLLSEGGFIPLADGRVREDIPFENYRFYRKLLEEMTTSK